MRPESSAHLAADDGEVAFAHAAVLEIDFERTLGRVGPPAQNQAARLAIEAVRDLRRILAIALAQQIRERVLVIARGRMHGQACRLVEREDRIVLVQHVEVERHVRLFEGRAHQNHRLARPDTLARTSPGSVRAVGA